MTLARRPHVGWEVLCDAQGCRETTADRAPRAFCRTEDAALDAARQLGWVPVRIARRTFHACPLHQLWDPRLERWVATPLAVRA